MKKTNLIITTILVLFSLGCTKEKIVENIVEVDKEVANFIRLEAIDKQQIATKEKQTLRVPVESNVNYSVSSNASWVKVPATIEAGKSFSIELEENQDSEVREAKLTLNSNGLQVIEISVKQGGVAPFSLMSPTLIEIKENPTFTLKIKTNIQYDLVLPSWVKAKTDNSRAAVRTDELQFSVENTESIRYGEIKLEGKSPNTDITTSSVIIQNRDLSQAPKFAVISDTHMKPTGNDSYDKIRNTLEFLVAKQPEAIFIVGDVTDYGKTEEYQRMITVVGEKVPSTIPVYYTTGNHDLYEDPDASKFKTHFKQDPNQYFELKGHPFIIVGMNNKVSPYYDNTATAYLEEKLALAAKSYPNKPIFVFYHVPLTGTVYGSSTTEGWGSNVLQNVINKYPQAIAFSGHSHFPIGDERSINQNIFTSINLGSTSYSEIEKGFEDGIHPAKYQEVTEGIMVTPEDNESLKNSGEYYKDFKVQRFDTYRKEEIKEPWLIKAPHNGSAFTYKNRSGASPSYAAGAKIEVKAKTSSSASIEWEQAKGANTHDKVHHYEVKVLDNNNQEVQTKKVFSLFYLNSTTPSKLQFNVTGLAPATAYKILVTAVNSWYGQKSSPIEVSITTDDYTVDPSITAPIADLFDVNFTNSKAVDYSTSNHTIASGTSTIVYSYNNTLKQYLVTYTNNSQSMHRLDYANNTNFINKFTKSFSLEVFYKNTNTTGNINIVSGLEAGGIGIEQATGGNTELWARIGGSYKTVGATKTNATDYFHMVYTFDGSKLIAYTNGTKVAELAITGDIQLPTNTAAHWFAIGGDAHTSANAQLSMPGDIVFTRLYSKAVSSDEVFRLNEQITKRKALTKVDDLNYVLTNMLPVKLISASGTDKTTIENLQLEGWNLMRSLGSTDTQIQTFLNKVTALNF